MSLVFAAFTPHPPMLIPSIGKEAAKDVEKTKVAFEKLEEELYLSRPDIIITISPHGSCFADAFTLNVCPEYETDLKEFGDLTTKLKFKGEMNLSSFIREAGKERGISTTMISENQLDHGVAIPLFFLTPHLPNITLLPIGFCEQDSKLHFDFGYLLKEQIMNTNKRVAVIASGDLSHALSTDAPAGFNQAGEKFDAKIQELLSSRNVTGLLNLDKQLINDAAECGYRSLLILTGILRDMNYEYRQYAYEKPFGVGYLTSHFVI